jgi:hypothetical protein
MRISSTPKFVIAILLLITTLPISVYAKSTNWRIVIGYAYLSGFDEFNDTYKHIANKNNKGNDIHNNSFGLKFRSYVLTEKGYRLGAALGPAQIVAGDATHFLLPSNITTGFQFCRQSSYSPYIDIGLSYHFNYGDYYSNTDPGFYGSAGIKIFNQKKTSLGIEAAYDSSITKLKDKNNNKNYELKVGEVTLFIYADF